MSRLALHWQIAIALVLAVLAGFITGKDMAVFGVSFYSLYAFLGDLFLNALKMLIVPLIMSSIISGVASIGDNKNLGRLGGKTLLYYMTTSLLAILLGLATVNILQPGIADGQSVGAQLNLDYQDEKLEELIVKVEAGASTIGDIFLRMVPPNIVAAAAEGRMLGMIFFSLLFGFFMTRVAKEKGAQLIKFWDAVFDVMIAMTMWVMKFAPLAC